MRMSFLLSETLTGLRRNATMTAAVVVTVAVSLAFLGAALLLGKQVEVMKGYWYDRVEVAVFLCPEASAAPTCGSGAVTPQRVEEIRAELLALPEVREVFFETREEAFRRYLEQYREVQEVASVTVESMAPSWRVKLADPEQSDVVRRAMTARPGVENVVDHRQLFAKLFQLLDGLRLMAILLAGFQVVAALLLIMNTVRLTAYERRQETGIMRLVGASRLTIALPFVLQGALAGFAGAAIASALVAAGQAWLVEGTLAEEYPFTPYVGWPHVAATVPWLFVLGMGLSALASYVSLRRYLRR